MNSYWVMKSGKPCKIQKGDLHKHGVLVPFNEGETPHPIGLGYSTGKRKAISAITRTLTLAEMWRQSVHAGWDKVKALTEPGIFTIEKRKVEE